MRVVTYDIEIADDPTTSPTGWEGARRGDCGLASMVLYDTNTGRYHVYDRSTLANGVAHLNAAGLLVSFDGLAFDTPVLEHLAGESILPPQYDIMAKVRDAMDAEYGRWRPGSKLGQLCRRTIGLEKSGHGEHAPKLYHEGRYAELIDYNLNDVFLTRVLFNHIMDHGFVVMPCGESIDLPQMKGVAA